MLLIGIPASILAALAWPIFWVVLYQALMPFWFTNGRQSFRNRMIRLSGWMIGRGTLLVWAVLLVTSWLPNWPIIEFLLR